MEIATADRCFCSAQQRGMAAAETSLLTTAAAAGAARHQDMIRPSPRRTSQPHRRHGRPRMQRPSTQMWKTPAQDGGHRLARTQQQHQEVGKTWPRDPADRNPADCLPDNDLTQLSTTKTTIHSSIILMQPKLQLVLDVSGAGHSQLFSTVLQ